MKRAWPALVRMLVPIVLIGVIWTLADAEDALSRLGNIDWPWVVWALVAANLQILASALRWKWVADRLGQSFTLRWAVAEYYLAQLVNQSVPGGVVGDASRAVRSRHSAGFSKAAQAVIIERLAGQVMLFATLAVGVLVFLLVPGGIEWSQSAIQITLGALTAVVIAGTVAWFGRRRISKIRNFGAALKISIFDPAVLPKQMLLGVVIVGLNLAGFAFAARATGSGLSLEAVIVVIPLILSAMLIPATISGWGYREGAAAALFPLVGLSAAAGLAASLVFGLVILAASLPGILVLFSRRAGKSASAANP
ncbi:hypothetical protein GCM10007989_31370 [Devosia pacifica]|uniref:Flippase-like domain-containing protein n=1 Tax=Devosia pacifica TaxID=1335967 RepID=A0A918VX09_9HYPH|nr:lysylphosphatidylglycerol synthase transmembrane domain-containing protein [Devosia pacifica]GHA32975.1 hypothetical protein GCM10007989_31370 [Devosia pacifica]